MEIRKTDIHCHILPGIDDGAKNLEVSAELLRKQRNDGVENIVFTPHFNSDHITVDKFIERRAAAFEKLSGLPEFKETGMSFKLGCEVYYTVDLPRLDLEKLCFEKTPYILVELPTQARPHGVRRTLGDLVSSGFTPIIAHVERYSYMLSEPSMLYDLIETGCLAHINAEAILKKTKVSPMVNYFVRHGLVHTLCTDCHSVHRRPPDLKEGLEETEKKLGENYSRLFMENAERIFNGKPVDVGYIKKPRKLLGLWL